MTDWIYRVDMTVYQGGSTQVLRYATRPYATPATHPSLPNQWFEDRVIQPLSFRREMFGADRTYGDMEIAHGEVILNNSDGGLDFLRSGYSFDGRKIALYKIDPDNLAAADIPVWSGVTEDFELDVNTLTMAVRDLTYLFDRALQPTKYAGTNSLPAGLEGTANDLQGKPKPKWFGTVYNVEPPCVNTTRLIYQVSDSALISGFSLTVYDKRSALTAGISRTITDFQNASSSATVSSIDTTLEQITLAVNPFATGDPVHVASTGTLPGGVLDTQYYYARVVSVSVISLHPTAADAVANTNIVNITSVGSGTITVARNRTPYGRYDWCSDSSGSYIRTGLQATRLTFDGTNGTAGTDDTFDQVVRNMLSWANTTYTDLAGAGMPISIDDRIGSTQQGMRIGHFWSEETTIYQAMREICATHNVSLQLYMSTSPSALRLAVQRVQLSGDSNSSVLAIDETNIVPNSLKRIRPQDESRGIPAWRITVNYKRNHAVMTASDLAGAALSEIAFAAEEYRSVKLDNPATKDAYPSAPELVVTSSLALQSDATQVANDWANQIFVPGAQMMSVQIPLDDFAAYVTHNSARGLYDYQDVVLGESRINVTFPRFAMSAGKNFAAVAYTLDYRAKTAELTLWG